jgi:hypothetical protein
MQFDSEEKPIGRHFENGAYYRNELAHIIGNRADNKLMPNKSHHGGDRYGNEL